MRMPLPIALLIIFACTSTLIAAAANPDFATASCGAGLHLNSGQVAQRLAMNNAQRAKDLHGFESQRHYELDYTGFPYSRSAEMTVDVSYRAPGNKKLTVVAESGSKLILTRVLHRLLESEQESSADEASRNAVALTSDNYRFALRGCAAAAGRDLYVMDVEPLRETKFLYRGTIWVDALDFAVVRIEAEPAKNPSIFTKRSEIHHQYQKIGEFYLPFSNETVTEVRLGGRSVLKIRYENYRVDPAENREQKTAKN